jgi:hypothetical protein
MNGYTKLFQDIVTSTIWQAPNDMRVLWVTILALKGQDNICRATVPALAKMCDMTIEECEAYLERFQAPDKHSRSQEYEGRRLKRVDGGYLVLNGQKYQDLLRGYERRDYVRDKVAEHRARKARKQKKITVNNVNTVNPSSPSPSPSPEERERGAVAPPNSLSPGALEQMIQSTERLRQPIIQALNGGSLEGLLRAFGCRQDGDRPREWSVAAIGTEIGLLGAILWGALERQQPITEPSELRTALADYDACPQDGNLMRAFEEFCGIPCKEHGNP